MAYKIVDYFNGFEWDGRYKTRADAEKDMAKLRKDFYELHTRNAIFCKGIVDEHDTWYFNHEQNKFIWG